MSSVLTPLARYCKSATLGAHHKGTLARAHHATHIPHGRCHATRRAHGRTASRIQRKSHTNYAQTTQMTSCMRLLSTETYSTSHGLHKLALCVRLKHSVSLGTHEVIEQGRDERCGPLWQGGGCSTDWKLHGQRWQQVRAVRQVSAGRKCIT